MHLSAKQAELADRIASALVTAQHAPGHRITEEQLTAQFHVSRSPVRAVMQFLSHKGFLVRRERGYFIPEKFPEFDAESSPIPKSADQELYEVIARDRAQNEVPEQFSEAELMRRYGVPRSQLIRVLNRLSVDGFVEPAAGHGWRFSPTLNSADSFRDSYRFRMIVEPQGLLEPTFHADPTTLKKLRDQQMSLAHSSEPRQLFEANATFHETLAGFSHNSFIVEAVRRHSRLRRLNEQLFDNGTRKQNRIGEHVAIIDALLEKQQEWASSLLRRHLDIAWRAAPSFLTNEESSQTSLQKSNRRA